MALPLLPRTNISTTPSGGFYVIPTTKNTLIHVNANDLANNTAQIGPAWVKNGTITFNNGGLGGLSSVGPFSDSNYLSLPTSNPANVNVAPITVVMIINDTSITANQGVFETGTYGSGGYGLFVANSDGNAFAPYFSNGTQPIGTTVTTGVVHVLFTGIDTSGVVYAQVDNGSLATASGGTLTAGTTNTFIGRYTSTGFSFNGLVYELMISTDAPSTAAFTALYNKIVANGG